MYTSECHRGGAKVKICVFVQKKKSKSQIRMHHSASWFISSSLNMVHFLNCLFECSYRYHSIIGIMNFQSPVVYAVELTLLVAFANSLENTSNLGLWSLSCEIVLSDAHKVKFLRVEELNRLLLIAVVIRVSD